MLKKQTVSGLNYIFSGLTEKAGAKYIFTPTNLKNTFFSRKRRYRRRKRQAIS